MTAIDGPLGAPDRLHELEQLFKQLHSHHLVVASYTPLVTDLDESWSLRRRWYEQIVADGGRYFLARDELGAPVGYGLVSVTSGPDDTFAVHAGIAEIISLVVDSEHRGRGVGHRLMAAMTQYARERDVDVLKVAVMTGNRSAEGFYAMLGFIAGEHVLYRPIGN